MLAKFKNEPGIQVLECNMLGDDDTYEDVVSENNVAKRLGIDVTKHGYEGPCMYTSLSAAEKCRHFEPLSDDTYSIAIIFDDIRFSLAQIRDATQGANAKYTTSLSEFTPCYKLVQRECKTTLERDLRYCYASNDHYVNMERFGATSGAFISS